MDDIIKTIDDDNFDIAVIGMSGRFPGAQDLEEYWENLQAGVESITFFSNDELKKAGVGSSIINDPNYVKASSLIDKPDYFDAPFFGYSPKEAEMMDPQHRLFLECAWEALEDAGYDTERYEGFVAVYGGASMNTYLLFSGLASSYLRDQLSVLIGNDKDFLTTRVSYKMNLRGPSVTVQTACSTSLVAIHLSCQSLLSQECDIALAGGVSVKVPYISGYFHHQGSIFSPDGHCKTFDANAAGTIFGSGVGIVVLKRLNEAIKDDDHIYAVIKGTGINNDGSTKVDYTAPSVESQSMVILQAMENAGVDARSVSYVEAHGTGTILGDPIEIAALTKAYRKYTNDNGFCAIGSVKTNVGHLDAAAGVAGFIKTVLALKHKSIPPSINFNSPNKEINFENTPFYVSTSLSTWNNNSHPLRAGVNSLGVGGTNVHVILEEAPVIDLSGDTRSCHALMFSARTETALDNMTDNFSLYLKKYPDVRLTDCTYTLQTGRREFNQRRVVICKESEEAIRFIESRDSEHLFTSSIDTTKKRIAFVFPGQGAQYPNMGLELYQTERRFKKNVDKCADILNPILSMDIRDIIYPTSENFEEAGEKLKQTYLTQPVLFVIEYAIARLFIEWGIIPDVMVGHSIGEYVAACLAGVFSLEDALALVSVRGKLIQELPPGFMTAVPLPQSEIMPLLDDKLSIAVISGPELCVVSGKIEAVTAFEEKLIKKDVSYRRLHTSHAFHSKMMVPIVDSFVEELKKINRNSPKIPFVSNVTGSIIQSNEATSPEYWGKHLCQTVHLSGCIREIMSEPSVFLELGPGHTLSTLVKQHAVGQKHIAVYSTMRHPKDNTPDAMFLMNSIGKLWLEGVRLDWSVFYEGQKCHKISLPTYPFDRKPYSVHVAGGAKSNDVKVSFLFGKKYENSSYHRKQHKIKIKTDYEGAPKGKTEKVLAEMWAELLGVKDVLRTANFFDLGGTSLMALRLFTKIEKKYSKRLPLATLNEAATIKKLAELIDDKEWKAPWSSLVAIQPVGSNPPFFCVHAHGGNVVGYNELAQYIGQEQPFYGLQAQGLDGRPVGKRKIEDIAAYYIQEIKKVQSHGPYFIGGFCFGGQVAFEMAQQLKSNGEKVAYLVMIDNKVLSNYPRYKSGITKLHRIMFKVVERIDFEWSNLKDQNYKGKVSYLAGKARRAITLSRVLLEKCSDLFTKKSRTGMKHSLACYLNMLEHAHNSAFEEYVPKPYQGRVTIFRASKQPLGIIEDPTIGWGPIVDGELDLIEIPGHHLDLMMGSSVKALAERLKPLLNKEQQKVVLNR